MKPIPIIVLAATLVSLVGCKSSSPPASMAAPRMHTVMVLNDSYDGQSIRINRGDTVRWVLDDNATLNHTVTALPPGTFDSDFTQLGAIYDYTFNQNGTFLYSCRVHGVCDTGCDMKGSVLVGSSAPDPPDRY